MTKNLLNMSLEELESALLSLKEQKYRTKQLYTWFYQKHVTDLNQMSNISVSLKEKILQNFEIKIPEITDISRSLKDNSYKFLLKTHDNKLIESILMPVKDRVTICVSCMIGCPLKCKFCATGSQIGFIRKLDQSEILGQIIAINHYAKENNIAQNISNVVFMGMGEPLLNLENIEKSVKILLDPNGFGLSRSKITLSTAGITDKLSDFINKYRIKLAVSLHFSTDEQRSKFMPINIKYPLKKLIEELKKIVLAKRDYITIEYLLLKDINDSLDNAKQLIRLLDSLKIKVNLIPYNPTKDFPATSASEESINNFAKFLRSKNIMVTVRRSLGQDIEGACGQFALKKN
ncbi:23S rRNA (adenine(2503)-C(2))-methyltransferase RlmN [Candidatus Babeliales bacterium]|nr:23S rRNA (adenine(2503)-C(2))-methyltransferase RlmN [Candidatus Babeliales bacterium]MCF7899370.1 23S rRNA (adenine(2503)-C(2))-methyltransferase RlmN [Candidatus Babeliales bacterium]